MKDFNFQPFDKVLVRDNDQQNWRCDFFSHVDEVGDKFCTRTWYEQVIPYNEDTKHLVGTSEPYISPEEAPKFEFGDVLITLLNSGPDCRYSYEELQNVCIYLAEKALSLERDNASLRSDLIIKLDVS